MFDHSSPAVVTFQYSRRQTRRYPLKVGSTALNALLEVEAQTAGRVPLSTAHRIAEAKLERRRAEAREREASRLRREARWASIAAGYEKPLTSAELGGRNDGEKMPGAFRHKKRKRRK